MNWLTPAKGALICTLRIHIVRFAHGLAPLGLPPVALPAGQNQSQVHSIFVFLILGGSLPPDQKNKISQNPVHQKSPLGS